jgi:simple sugar transport system ATP-binding protein
VMHGGHLSPARPAQAWTRETIGLAMAGHAETPQGDPVAT